MSGLFSRRSFLQTAAAVPCAALSQTGGRIVIHVAAPAGPAPSGAPAETAIPFARGQLRWPAKFRVLSPRGAPVLAQMHPSSHWPDSSVRWLHLVFEPEAGPGDYSLASEDGPAAGDLVTEQSGSIVLDSGAAQLRLNRDGWVEEISAPSSSGSYLPVIRGATPVDLLITERGGSVFRASAAKKHRVTVEERGPVRGTVRIEGRTRSNFDAEFFDFILRCTVYRGRPEVVLSVTWMNTTSNSSEKVRDIRLVLPFAWEPGHLVFGCERGIYDGPFLKDWPVWLVQDDYDRYWARTRNPDGRAQNLASGGANGERCPGWLYISNAARLLGVSVPEFYEKYPNEISVGDGGLAIGLWSEHANAHLKSKPLLPSDPFGTTPYQMTRYWPVMPHPYSAFVASEDGCLDARQGVAMTQTIVLGLWAGQTPTPLFEQKVRDNTLRPVRATLDPQYVTSTGVVGPLSPRNPGQFTKIEEMFDENFGWFDRHIDLQKCYSKFDYGDFHYFTPGTDYLTTPGTKWGDMGEMAREGYWHNNERDPLRGLILYHLRTGSPEAWKRCEIAARHALDVDVRHFPHWGMWTHSYGHCFLALGEGGEPDHSWLLGLLHWAGLSGDPVAADWITRCGERLASLKLDFEQEDARTVSVYLHMMCQFHSYTGEASFMERARPAVAAFRKLQKENGSWPAYLGNMRQPRIEGFVEHALVALSDYYALERVPEVREMIDRALVHCFGPDGDGTVDPGESPLALYALAMMAEITSDARYARTALSVLSKLRDMLNVSPDPYGRGDLWAGWGPNKTDTPGSADRTSQLLSQTRPLSPATLLAWGQPAMAALARLDGK